MAKIKILNFANLTAEMEESLTKQFPEIELYEGKGDAWNQIPLDEIEIVIGWDKEKGAKLLSENQGALQWIQSTSAGVDYFPLAELARQKVALVNAGGVQNVPITEHVLGMLLVHYRMFRKSFVDQEKRVWDPDKDRLGTLLKKKMLIVGTGNIGQTLAKAAQALGVHTYGINTTGKLVPGFEQCYAATDLLAVVGEMDIVVNILPLTPETYHLYNKAFFEQVKEDVVFINVGRGKSVNTDDLIASMETGKIGFAGLDVFEEEPLPQESPLWEMERVLITPHVAGHRPDYTEAVLDIFVHNLTSWLEQKKLVQNVVDLSRGY